MASYNRCWTSEKWVCNENPIGQIFEDAYYKFSDGWEYWDYGTGGNANGNELKDTDCWYLVTNTLNGLGYHSAPRFMLNRWGEYFCQVPLKDAVQGDIMAWDLFGVVPQHVEILEYKNPITVDGEKCWQVNGWGAQDYPKSVDPEGTGPEPHGIGGSKTVVGADGKTNPGFPWFNRIGQLTIWRPKRKVFELECVEVENGDIWIVRRFDPLVLDLDGNGIQTVGTSSGMHFDGDHNGFKEATGWAAPGDGMLMLDMNGNGRLDSGKELFGDFTILRNGVKADNGFQALAYYDSNGDGKIDASDPIWSQLRIWQYNDVLLSSDLSEDDPDSASATGQRYFVSQDSSGCG